MFDVLKTGLDGLDSILAGGIRYPAGSAAFVFITGGAGSGKTVLTLELAVRAWLDAPDGSTCLYYSVEHSPQNLYTKLEHDFDFYGIDAEIRAVDQEVPNKLCLEAKTEHGTKRLVLTQATAATLDDRPTGSSVDVEWILAEIGNYRLTGSVYMACIDNISLLMSDLDYYAKRAALLATRRELMAQKIHGIFVQEVTDVHDLRRPNAEEFSTDCLIELAFQDEHASFKARTLEISKARHQYYYRGKHHFSIAGRSVEREGYLGARNERGPGIHIYPSVAAQLSIARDAQSAEAPSRGNQVIDLGHPDLLASFLDGTGPTERSSTVLLAEPGTRHTYLALRFLAVGQRAGETTLMVSTKEDQDALRRICNRQPLLRESAMDGDDFAPDFRVLYLHPEFISAGKFTWDLLQQTLPEDGKPVTRIAFDSIYRLSDRFPLLRDQNFMIPALVDILRYRSVTPMFVDLVPPGSATGRTDFNPAPYMTTFDNVLHLYLEDDEGTPRPYLRVLKSTANEFSRTSIPVDYERT